MVVEEGNRGAESVAFRVNEKGSGSVMFISTNTVLDISIRSVMSSFSFSESTHKGGNKRSKYVTQTQQRRPESPPVTLTWHACKYKVHKLHQKYILDPEEDDGTHQ